MVEIQNQNLETALQSVSQNISKFVQEDIDSNSGYSYGSSFSRDTYKSIYLDSFEAGNITLKDVFKNEIFREKLIEFLNKRGLDENLIIQLANELSESEGGSFTEIVLKYIPYDRDYDENSFLINKNDSKEKKLQKDISRLVSDCSREIGKKIKQVETEVTELKQQQRQANKERRNSLQESVILKLLLNGRLSDTVKFDNIENLEKNCLEAFINYLEDFFNTFGTIEGKDDSHGFLNFQVKEFNEKVKPTFDRLKMFALYLYGNGNVNKVRFQSGIKGFIHLLNEFINSARDDNYAENRKDFEEFFIIFSELDKSREAVSVGDLVRKIDFNSIKPGEEGFQTALEDPYKKYNENKLYAECFIGIKSFSSSIPVPVNLLESEESLKEPLQYFNLVSSASEENDLTIDQINSCGNFAYAILRVLRNNPNKDIYQIANDLEEATKNIHGDIFYERKITHQILESFKQLRLRGLIKEGEQSFQSLVNISSEVDSEQDNIFKHIDTTSIIDPRKVEKLEIDIENPKLNNSMLVTIKKARFGMGSVGDVYTSNGSKLKINKPDGDSSFYDYDLDKKEIESLKNNKDLVELGEIINKINNTGNKVSLEDGFGVINGKKMAHREFIDTIISMYESSDLTEEILNMTSLEVSKVENKIREGGLVFDSLDEALETLKTFSLDNVSKMDGYEGEKSISYLISDIKEAIYHKGTIWSVVEKFIIDTSDSLGKFMINDEINSTYEQINDYLNSVIYSDDNDVSGNEENEGKEKTFDEIIIEIVGIVKKILGEQDRNISEDQFNELLEDIKTRLANSEGFRKYWDWNQGPIHAFQKGSIGLSPVEIGGEIKWILSTHGELDTLGNGEELMNEEANKERIINGGSVKIEFKKLEENGWFMIDLQEILGDSSIFQEDIDKIANDIGTSTYYSGYGDIEALGIDSRFSIEYGLKGIKPKKIIRQGNKLFVNTEVTKINISPSLEFRFDCKKNKLTESPENKKHVTDFLQNFGKNISN